MFLLAILFPPLAVFLTGRPMQALISCVLTLCFWVPGSIHAVAVVNEYKADKRMKRHTKAVLKAQK